MSYSLSAAVQKGIYDALVQDPAVSGLVGVNVFDSVPSGSLPDLYVVLGQEKVRDRSDQTGHGANHDLTISVATSRPGFSAAKSAAGAVCDRLLGPVPILDRGRIVNTSFLTARTRREGQGARRIVDLIFRIRVSDE